MPAKKDDKSINLSLSKAVQQFSWLNGGRKDASRSRRAAAAAPRLESESSCRSNAKNARIAYLTFQKCRQPCDGQHCGKRLAAFDLACRSMHAWNMEYVLQ